MDVNEFPQALGRNPWQDVGVYPGALVFSDPYRVVPVPTLRHWADQAMRGDDLDWAMRVMYSRLRTYAVYDQYFEGVQRLAFASEKFKTAFGSTFREFADNLCPKVINVVADRLRISGFTCEDDEPEELVPAPALPDPAPSPPSMVPPPSAALAVAQDNTEPPSWAEIAWDIWTDNRMARWSGVAHSASLRLGDSYAVVWPDKQDAKRPRIHINRGSQMVVRYDMEDPGVINMAMKWYFDNNQHIRVNMYHADRIERWISENKLDGLPPDATQFIPYLDDPDGQGPVFVNPYGQVPVFHFANGVGPGSMGQSELKEMLPLQDALNKANMDLLVAMEFVGLPQRWATGVEPDIDKDSGTNRRDTFNSALDSILTLANENGRFGQFDAANLDQLLNVAEKWRVEIARVTGTPVHHILQPSSDAPSGEALKTAEAPLTSKVEMKAEAWGETWGDIMSFAVRIKTSKVVTFDTTWKDSVPRNSKDFLEGLVVKQGLGIPEETLWAEAGYSADEIEHMKAKKETQQSDLGGALLGAFDSGQASRPVSGAGARPDMQGGGMMGPMGGPVAPSAVDVSSQMGSPGYGTN